MRGLSNGTFRFGYCNGFCSTYTDPYGKDYCPRFGMSDRPESQRGRIPVPHPVEMHAVKLAASLYGQNMSDLDIANLLNNHQYRLPDGRVISFRTKGLQGKSEPGYFRKDNIREIIRNPFYVGFVAHYPTRPLDMEDDPESIRRRKAAPVKNRRRPQILQPGQHEPIYPREIWERNISIRNAKGSNPTSTERPRREYLLTGIGRCWICLEKSGNQAGFRGSTGSGLKYYQCATLLEKSKKAKDAIMFDDYLVKADMRKQPQVNWNQLIESHTSPTIRAERLGQQVKEMMKSLVIQRAGMP